MIFYVFLVILFFDLFGFVGLDLTFLNLTAEITMISYV